jgi:hypothetical protein
MAFTDQLTLANDLEFKGRVKLAALTAALDIAHEAATLATIDYHRQRQSLAFTTISDPEVVTARFAYAVAANPAITASSSDSDIQYTINTVWDAVAGIPQTSVPA